MNPATVLINLKLNKLIYIKFIFFIDISTNFKTKIYFNICNVIFILFHPIFLLNKNIEFIFLFKNLLLYKKLNKKQIKRKKKNVLIL